jgi:aminoglycoside phosphotransferase (APT) family kinase protein
VPTDAGKATILTPAEEQRLRRWLDGTLPGSGEFEIARISTGASNEIFGIERDGGRWVLRRPPRAKVSASAHDVTREYRVLRALDGTDVPHAKALFLHEDPELIGVPFMISEFAEGWAPEPPLPAAVADDANAQRLLTEAYVDTLARISSVPWQSVGLDGFGRPAGYLERQASRWRTQLERYRTREIPHIDEVAEWIDANRPTTQRTGLIHGDYHLPNVLIRQFTGSADLIAVTAVLDWEQSTIGDVMVDIGWLLALWEAPGEESLVHPGTIGMGRYPGILNRAEIAERYARHTELDLTDVRFYEILAMFKLACVLEGSWYRLQQGTSDSGRHHTFGHLVPLLASRAFERMHS